MYPNINITKSNSQYCSYCGKIFIEQISLQVHIQIHTDTSVEHCSYCEKNFKNRNSLLVHKYRSHEQCGHCSALDTPSRSPINSVDQKSKHNLRPLLGSIQVLYQHVFHNLGPPILYYTCTHTIPIVTTPTQLQRNLNCSWSLDMKMTVHTHPTQTQCQQYCQNPLLDISIEIGKFDSCHNPNSTTT